MKLIGLTGGIGTGKSTVSEYLISKGYQVLDADKISREIVEPNSETLIRLCNSFGKDILYEDGSLNRKKLADIVFSDPLKKEILDKIMHTKVIEILIERAKALDFEELVFIDAPLLFEAKLDEFIETVWVVDADDESRIKRVMERDQLSREEIQKRIKLQMDRAEKIKRADHVLNNCDDKENLYLQINELLNKYQEADS